MKRLCAVCKKKFNILSTLSISGYCSCCGSYNMELKPELMPECGKCGSSAQVWENQITGVLTCHRYECDNLKVQPEDKR